MMKDLNFQMGSDNDFGFVWDKIYLPVRLLGGSGQKLT